MVDLKKVYKANTKEYAEEKLLELEEKWGNKDWLGHPLPKGKYVLGNFCFAF